MPKKIWFLYLTILIDMIGLGVLIPVIPQLLGNPNSVDFLLNPSQQNLGFILLGLISAIYPIAMFFAAPILGALSDKFGRRPVLLISILGTSVGYFLFAWAIMIKNIPLLFFSRLVDGLTGGNIATVQASITDQVDPEHRAKAFGLMGATFGVGFVLGPFIGGKLADPNVLSWFNASTPFFFAGILAFVNLISIYFFFLETNFHIDKDRTINFFGSVSGLFRIKNLKREIRYLLVVSFLFNAGFAFFTSFFNVFLTQKFNFSVGQIGNFFGYIGIWSILTQLVVVRLTANKFSHVSILRFTYPAVATAIILYLLPTNPFWIFVIVPFFAIPNGMQLANFSALLSQRTPPKERGETLGINASFTALGQALPPLFAGFIAVAFAPSTPILIAGFFMLCAGVLFIYTERNKTDDLKSIT
ncbi:MAG: MFS transporter [Candidatus Levybacteria bacterium]|nr:MFS transporter [Candidatus Levybacteria bacterium]